MEALCDCGMAAIGGQPLLVAAAVESSEESLTMRVCSESRVISVSIW